MPSWNWIDERSFELRGERFVSGTMPAGVRPDDFLVIKPPELTTRYLQLIEDEAPKRIVEIGVKDGGSTAMIALLADPDLLLAVELSAEVPAVLRRFLDRSGLDQRVVTAFGLSQADRTGLTAAVDGCANGLAFDLVIDDASHILGPTRTSFEVLFPRLRPGGLYLVEDWASECTIARNLARFLPEGVDVADRLDAVSRVLHILNAPEGELPPSVVAGMAASAAELMAAGNGAAAAPDLFELLVHAAAHADLGDLAGPDREPVRPVADLAVELTMIAATRSEIVSEVRLDAQWLTVRRGPAELPLDQFRLVDQWADHFDYLPR